MTSATHTHDKRNLSFDAIRIFACLLVVLAHSPMPDASGNNGILLSTISLLVAPSIGLFFIVSGALLLPVRQETFPFLKRRFIKLGVPTVIWSIVYLLLGLWLDNREITSGDILSIPFSAQGSPVLWFMYVLLGYYLICPIISPYLEKIGQREANLYLVLILICFCFPVLPDVIRVQTGEHNILYYFYGYGGYFYIGWYLHRYPDSFQLPMMAAITFFIYLIALILKITNADIAFYDIFWCTSITTVLVSIFWFRFISMLCKKLSGLISEKSKNLIALTSNLTFGVFLIHFAVIRYCLWREGLIQHLNQYWLQLLVIYSLATLISFIVSYSLSYLRIGKYLIAYSKKHKKSC